VEDLKLNTKSNRISVTFSTKIDIGKLKNLSAANNVNTINEHSFIITTNDTNELRRQLLELAVAEQLDIISLQTEGNSLEDIFRNLTTTK
jgi:ABC-2 type transport system ATP-binding protein